MGAILGAEKRQVNAVWSEVAKCRMEIAADRKRRRKDQSGKPGWDALAGIHCWSSS